MGRTTALQDNYSSVEDAAASQRCSVICVIKVDRYGHVFLHKETLLMDLCGADAFAIATLEEAMLLMRALNAGFSSTMAKVAVNARWGGGGIRGRGAYPEIAQPTAAIFRSRDSLWPFLLAANYPDVGYRLTSMVIDAMQRLVEGGDVEPSDGMHVVRFLWIQVNVIVRMLVTAAASAPSASVGGRGD